MVRGATRFGPNSMPSLIDLAWVNNPASVVHCKNLSRPVADHNIIFTMMRLKGKIRNKNEIVSRDWKHFNQDGFKKRIEGMKWNEIYGLDDPNLAFSFLEEKMQVALDEFAPIKRIQPARRNKNWIQNETLELIKDRDLLKDIAVETNNENDWKLYRSTRNRVTLKIKKDKMNYFKDLYNRAEGNKDTKSLFRISKEQLGWVSEGPPTALSVEGEYITKPYAIAEKMSEYYEKKIDKLKQAIPTNNTDPTRLLRTSMENWSKAANRTEFQFRDVTLLEVTTILQELGNTTTMGYDKLDPMTLKLVALTIMRPIQHILNLSLKTQTYVSKWKLGKLLPLHKGEGCDRLSMSSFRPILILSIVSKIMEKAVHLQVFNYMDSTNQLNKNLHGYKTLQSTMTAMIQLTDFIGEAADANLISNAMMIDQSAAFDCVEDSILNEKLGIYNFSDNVRAWFRSYMSYQSQYINIGASDSNIRTVKFGVPQGSVLGPLLYTIYMNELP